MFRHVVFISGSVESKGHIYRVANRIAALRRVGARATCIPLERLGKTPIPADADVVVAYRCVATDALLSCRRECGERGIPWGVDFDDLVFLPELMHPSVVHFLSRLPRKVVTRWQAEAQSFQTVVGIADFAWAPTDALASELSAVGIPACVVPNGFEEDRVVMAATAARDRDDGLVRIGYASGTPTHEVDFAQVVPALAELLAADRDLRFIALGHVDIDSFEALRPCSAQIERRKMVPYARLSSALAELDINIAPLVPGNRFCEAKSELKFFEAALVGVPTVASGTRAYARAIEHGETGLLVERSEQWHETLFGLKSDARERQRLGENARRSAIAHYGPAKQLDDLLAALRRVAPRPGCGDGFVETG